MKITAEGPLIVKYSSNLRPLCSLRSLINPFIIILEMAFIIKPDILGRD